MQVLQLLIDCWHETNRINMTQSDHFLELPSRGKAAAAAAAAGVQVNLAGTSTSQTLFQQ